MLMRGRSRYHYPLQSINVVLTFVGAYLGHHHHGRDFPATVRVFRLMDSLASQ